MRFVALVLLSLPSEALVIGNALATRATRAPSATLATLAEGAGGTPEELLLEAMGHLRSSEFTRVRLLVAEAQKLCDESGGPTQDQAALLQLISARLPAKPQPTSDQELSEMFPGTVAAPTGKSLIMAGTPTMAELAANAKAKQMAKAKAEAAKVAAAEAAAVAAPSVNVASWYDAGLRLESEVTAADAPAPSNAVDAPVTVDMIPPAGFVWADSGALDTALDK